ncbi:uncharacterized protein LOC116852367 isoform X2 [Odontomachus brunneus]|uniref:uncharacterized protein LOC116852367 isoform X2 n=1 Tax=Odontomachus brunneus TaxID=486640 RepID=UPI0013F19A42|nr:uncharacterized protein LOC116852367 isoform X2 [Odontomachus brunneus]
MLLHEFLYLTHNEQELLEYLRNKAVIQRDTTCPRCNNIINTTSDSDSLILHCTNKYYKQVRGRKRQRKVCNFKISILHNTWFAKGHLGLAKTCRFIAYFLHIRPPRQFFLMEELQICDRTVVDWTNFCRELLQQWITNGQKQIGGPGVTVEIDEAKIGKRKYNKGRIVKGQWVFGGIDRESAPGSTIYSDSWKAYSGLQNANYSHYTVNHKQNFIDPATGAHTQNIERLWRDMRAAIPRYGTRTYHYNGYLAEFIFKKQSNFGDRIDSFF